MKMFCLVSLVLSLVQLSPALPVSQNPLLSCIGSTGPVGEHLSIQQHSTELDNLQQSETQTAVHVATEDVVPTHFPARRAVHVALHYINIQHGSPYRVFGLQQVHRAGVEGVAAGGRKYELDFSMKDWASGGSAVFRCQAEVVFPPREQHSPPEVQYSCEGLRLVNRSSEEHDFYRKHRESAVTAHEIPDKYGNMSEDMKPFWHWARVAASVIMLRLSSEDTEYNMAQVANITQQETGEDQLMMKYHVMLHDMVSQKTIHWKLLSSWSPNRGVRVLETEWPPKCPHDVPPTSPEPVPSTAN